MWQASVRSTFGKSVVNEARVGYAGGFGGGTQFFPEFSDDQFNCSGVGCQSVGGKGYNLSIGVSIGPNALTSATAGTGPSTRYTPNYVFEDTVTWLKGSHTFSMGGTYTYTKTENWNDTVVPSARVRPELARPGVQHAAGDLGELPGRHQHDQRRLRAEPLRPADGTPHVVHRHGLPESGRPVRAAGRPAGI